MIITKDLLNSLTRDATITCARTWDQFWSKHVMTDDNDSGLTLRGATEACRIGKVSKIDDWPGGRLSPCNELSIGDKA